jgi:hypothetical protein
MAKALPSRVAISSFFMMQVLWVVDPQRAGRSMGVV